MDRLGPCSFSWAEIFLHEALLFSWVIWTICLSVLQVVFRSRSHLPTVYEPNSVPLAILFLMTLKIVGTLLFFAQFLFVFNATATRETNHGLCVRWQVGPSFASLPNVEALMDEKSWQNACCWIFFHISLRSYIRIRQSAMKKFVLISLSIKKC